MSEPKRIEVKRCELCPFEVYDEESGARWCDRDSEQMRMRRTPDSGVPDWCPLRTAAVLVSLHACHSTETAAQSGTSGGTLKDGESE